MKTTFKAAVEVWIGKDLPDGGPSDANVLNALVDRIESSDLPEAEKEDLLDKLALVAARFPPDTATGQA